MTSAGQELLVEKRGILAAQTQKKEHKQLETTSERYWPNTIRATDRSCRKDKLELVKRIEKTTRDAQEATGNRDVIIKKLYDTRKRLSGEKGNGQQTSSQQSWQKSRTNGGERARERGSMNRNEELNTPPSL